MVMKKTMRDRKNSQYSNHKIKKVESLSPGEEKSAK
jgi:hypothetical protein